MASVTSIYGRAFADVVFDSRLDAARIMEQLHSLRELLRANIDLQRVWENPAIAAEQKRAVLDAIAKRNELSKQVRNFVAVLIDHRRMHFFNAIVEQLGHELDARMGFAEAQITTSRDLNDSEKRTLEAQVERLTGKKVRARYSRDAAILGGAIVRVGSTIYDGSVLGQLESIREAIAGSSA